MSLILFLCNDNACLSQMAAGFARKAAPADIEIESAGMCAGVLHQEAVDVMAELGVDLGSSAVKQLSDLHLSNVDIVIAMTDDVARACPLLPGNPLRVDWGIDPGTVSNKDDVRGLRDRIRQRVNAFFEHGYCDAMLAARTCENLILSNTTDGIMAHDMQRRIFFFNKAAEEITGYKCSYVIGKDCHEIFPGYFCGAKCCFKDGDFPETDTEREVLFTTSGGGTTPTADQVADYESFRRRGGRGAYFFSRLHARALS